MVDILKMQAEVVEVCGEHQQPSTANVGETELSPRAETDYTATAETDVQDNFLSDVSF